MNRLTCLHLFSILRLSNKQMNCEGPNMNVLPKNTIQLNNYFFSYFRSCL